MFTAFNERNDFSYAFEKIRNAISAPGENNLYAATELGLGILLRKYEQFRQELDAAGELGNWEYDLDTYNHCIAVLQRYFTGNPSGLTERDARIYSHYLQTEHKRFVKLADELPVLKFCPSDDDVVPSPQNAASGLFPCAFTSSARAAE